ncbi:MAG TPA: ABC transporter substrate-binding protein [Gaiellaceae bacterium]|jgi:branched-chain amino acid transport system substrate-binding protein
MSPRRKGGALVALATAVSAVVMLATSASAATDPIVIGWAYDSKGSMSPFDVSAVASAQLHLKTINRRGGALGRQIALRTCDTQGNKPTVAKACAAKLLGQGADIIFTTCDVQLAAPVVQEAINRGVLAVATCIGTDQMGPKRFGKKGRLAFTFGNVAQDEGSAMAEYAWKRGWRDAALATDTVIDYFQNVVQAFEARWKQLGGKIVAKETYQSSPAGNPNPASAQNVVNRLQDVDADVIVTATAPPWGAMVPILNGLRTLGVETPMINSWAGDGNYWLPKDPEVTNYYFVTYASVFGDDPSKVANAWAKQVKPLVGSYITGPAAIDGVVTAIKRAKSTQGIALAAQMEKFKNVPTVSGRVTFSPSLHAVSGRAYRVIRIQNNQPKVVASVTAKVLPKI